jgi:Tfp pilus assembly PilM family ATPase
VKLAARIAERVKVKPIDVVGLDISSTGVKAVRLKRQDGAFLLLAADFIRPPSASTSSPDKSPSPEPLIIPKQLRGRHAAIAVSGEAGIIKLLTFPGHFDQSAEAQISEYMGIENPSRYRLAYKVISESRTESRVLAVALPEEAAGAACMILPSGLPAPHSLEISGLASLTAFLNGPVSGHGDESVGIVDFGARVSTVAFFNKTLLALVRKLEMGTEKIVQKVCERLGVDATTAEQILFDGSFDISQPMAEVLDSFAKQIIISRDFVERRENCRVKKIYVCGGVATSASWLSQIRAATGADVGPWNPFGGMQTVAGSLPERLQGQESRFAAALGAAMAAPPAER